MECTACGYWGEMQPDGRVFLCPACGVVSHFESKILRTIECPRCARKIGVTIGDGGKTMLCPGCSCFLGTPVTAPALQKAAPSQ